MKINLKYLSRCHIDIFNTQQNAHTKYELKFTDFHHTEFHKPKHS
jgi:hypothetical protein